MSNAVEIDDVYVTYQRKAALRGVSLRVGECELLGLFGYNGAGKSTLLKAINGLVGLKSGMVRVCGENLTRATVRDIRIETAYVPQSLEVDPRMPVTALEVTLMGRCGRLGLMRRYRRDDVDAAAAALAQVNASNLASRPFGHLSGGEQQRVYIARALAQTPRLLLLDEPTNNLDWKLQQELSETIRTVHREQKLTTIVVSHDVDFLAEMCDRIVLMQDGRIVGERDPSVFAHCCRSHSLFDLPQSSETRGAAH